MSASAISKNDAFICRMNKLLKARLRTYKIKCSSARYYLKNIERFKQLNQDYYKANVEKRQAIRRKYANSARCKIARRAHFLKNKDKINQRRRELYALNPQKRRATGVKKALPRITCECGVNLVKSNLKRHLKSVKHNKILTEKKEKK